VIRSYRIDADGTITEEPVDLVEGHAVAE
jgi:hypothetical protein